MDIYPTASGFVVHYGPVAGSESVAVRRASREGQCRGPNFRLLCRPARTTAESAYEAQPIIADGVIVAYAGIVHNRKAIADQLCLPSLAQASDGVVLHAAYRKWKASLVQHVLGEYSFVVVDLTSKDLIIGKDSLGLGRIYRSEGLDGIWAASDLDLLLGALPNRPALSRDALAEYIAGGGLMTSGRTVYDGIDELPQGSVMICGPQGYRTLRFWQPDPIARIKLSCNEEYDDALRSLMSEGVRSSLRSHRPVWVDLSGGLDSSSVAAIAVRQRQSGELLAPAVSTFSLVTSQTRAGDEKVFQDAFLETYRVDNHVVDIDQHLSFSSEEPQSAHPSKAILYRPLWNATNELLNRTSALAHLNGRGGDNLFCGDDFPPRYLHDLLRSGRLGCWIRETKQWANTGRRSVANLVWECSRHGLTDPYAGDAHRGIAPDWLAPDFRDKVVQSEKNSWAGGSRLFASPARELQYRAIMQTAAIARFIRIGDERHPLLYRPLVEFCLALPWEQLLRADENRVIQRRAMQGILPEIIRKRQSKSSGTVIFLRALRENWKSASAMVQGARLAELGLVDSAAFRSACERLRHGLLAKQFRYIAGALSLEIWLNANQQDRRLQLLDFDSRCLMQSEASTI